MADSSRYDRLAAGALLVAGLLALLGLPWILPRGGEAERPAEAKLAQRAGASIKLGAKLAELYGIKAEPVRRMTWQPRLAVYGRVIPNTRATAEIRAPFAGLVRAPANGWPGVGAAIAEGQTLAVLQARFSPQERLDLQAKAVEAQEKLLEAEKVLKIRDERVAALSKIKSVVSGPEVDQAHVAQSDARSGRAIAAAQAKIWQQTLEAVDNSPIRVDVSAPLDGEVVEVGVQPGTAIEAGAMLLKLVDFRRVLVRLDVPVGQGPPPAELELFVTSSDGETRLTALTARRAGPAPGVDAASQYAGYFYEADGPSREATWRPGLFAQAHVPDPAGRPAEATVVPASALLYHQGRALVYVQVSPGRFERREVQVLGREGDHVYVGRGVRAGEEVVNQQAQVLLSEEFRGDADDD